MYFCVWHLMSVQEYYEFLESDAKNIFTKLGTFAWLAMAIAVVETLICIKFSKGCEGNEVAGPLRAFLSRCPAVLSISVLPVGLVALVHRCKPACKVLRRQ